MSLSANHSVTSFKYLHIYGPVLVTLWLGLFVDSVAMSTYFPDNQTLTTILVICVFTWIFMHVSKVAKQLMLIGVVLSYIGEVTFSLGLGMYTYRLENVPHYVPLGHAIVYTGVYYMTKEAWVRQHRHHITRLLYPLMVIYSTLWLILANDVFGFVSMLIIIILFRRHPETKLFFLLMFFMVVYLELLGTYYQCWVWPNIWFDVFPWMPSANPPSGIGVVYFAFDAGCLLVYKFFNLKSWRRFRALQASSTR